MLADNSKINPNTELEIDVPRKKQVFLDIILTTLVEGVPMSDEEISDEVSTFVLAVRLFLSTNIYCI